MFVPSANLVVEARPPAPRPRPRAPTRTPRACEMAGEMRHAVGGWGFVRTRNIRLLTTVEVHTHTQHTQHTQHTLHSHAENRRAGPAHLRLRALRSERARRSESSSAQQAGQSHAPGGRRSSGGSRHAMCHPAVQPSQISVRCSEWSSPHACPPAVGPLRPRARRARRAERARARSRSPRMSPYHARARAAPVEGGDGLRPVCTGPAQGPRPVCTERGHDTSQRMYREGTRHLAEDVQGEVIVSAYRPMSSR